MSTAKHYYDTTKIEVPNLDVYALVKLLLVHGGRREDKETMARLSFFFFNRN